MNGTNERASSKTPKRRDRDSLAADAVRILDLVGGAFRQLPPLSGRTEVADRFSVGLRRNDRRDVARLEPLDERVGVVSLVSNHGLGREVFEQRLGLRYIVNLPRCERERDWIAERIDGRVDFRRQSAT